MIGEIFRFELRYQLRQPVFWIASAVFFLLSFIAVASDAVAIGGSIGNVNRNAPFVVMQLSLTMATLGVFFTTAFVSGTVMRDHQNRTAEIFFSLPVRKVPYLLGRFGGALFASLGLTLAVALGIFLASLMPWLDPERVGPFRPMDYLFSIGVLAVPVVVFTACVFFAVATLTRSTILTYTSVVGMLVGFTVAGNLLADVENDRLATLLDPFGFSAFSIATKYWTVGDRNTLLLPIDGAFLLNRAVWMSFAALVLAFTVWRFRFVMTGTQRRTFRLPFIGRSSVAAAEDVDAEARGAALPALPQGATRQVFGPSTTLRQFLTQTRLEVRLVLKSVAFPILVAFGVLNMIGNTGVIDQLFGTPVYPVTHLMVQILQSSTLFMFVIVTFYGGELVWRDRGLEASDVVDSLPAANGVFWGAKVVAFLLVILALLVTAIVTGMGVQLFRGYTNFEPGLYLRGMILVAGMPFLIGAVVSLFFQVLSNNRYLGFLWMLLYIIGMPALSSLDFDHNLYKFGFIPGAPYSDMNGYGHFVTPVFWFTLYWALGSALLVLLVHLLWVRGRIDRFRDRLRIARQRLTPTVAAAGGAFLVAFVATGGWIFYNTNVLNEYVPGDEARERQARYEKEYKQYEGLLQPKIRKVYAEVDIYPERRGVDIRGRYTLENATGSELDTIHIALDPRVDIDSLTIPGARLSFHDDEAGYSIYDLDDPMAVGEVVEMAFDLGIEHRGFVNNNSNTLIVRNGTFFNSGQSFPSIGYSRAGELNDPNRRRKLELPAIQRAPDLDDPVGRQRNYISDESDWIDFETVVSTSADQIALAPGYLQREWEEDGRRYFHYKMDAPILGFWAYLSADWEVARDQWNDVAIEIYYDEKHPYNVDRMIEGTKKSLEYFTENFSPYQHRQVRILEFPRYARFAQSFPNTIPFSESIGFIAKLDEDDEEAIDYVFYVTAHEVAHQWWAHQVIGGFVQGSTIMSETLSQYSALMVMEKEYGREKMRRFLKYELDNYLRSRGGELIEELPLLRVENQGYIHYRKGSLVMYALRDAIGEEALNRALSRYIEHAAFQQPPYTYSREFVSFLREEIPDELDYMVEDLFETITLYDNRAVLASTEETGDGRFRVRVEVEAHKFRADGQGIETEVPISDWVDVAVFGEKEEGGPATGRLLAIERRQVSSTEGTFEIVVDERPVRAGIDPFHKLIDRNPDDNTVRVDEASSTPAAGAG